MKIGLLGGSFNPAHAGHLHISKEAIKRLGLDEVRWIISPQNPLKSKSEIADYNLRLRKAREVAAKNPQIKICEIEAEQGLQYTIDTLRHLLNDGSQPSKARRVAGGMGACPHPNQFIWLMGADNLLQFHHWKNWREIFMLVPIAVFNRDTKEQAALESVAAKAFADKRIKRGYKRLAEASAPCWAYISMRKHPESATRLRNMLGKAAFLVHNAKR